MSELVVCIERLVDEHFPGFVECSLLDAFGRTHRFIEKAPVVSMETLRSDSQYPRPGAIACRIVREWHSDDAGPLVLVDTERPWGVESTEGRTSFVVLASQVSAQRFP